MCNTSIKINDMDLPKDYKPEYETYDGVSVAPTDEVWIAAMDIDSFNYIPKMVTAKQAEKAGERIYYSTYEICDNACYEANSL